MQDGGVADLDVAYILRRRIFCQLAGRSYKAVVSLHGAESQLEPVDIFLQRAALLADGEHAAEFVGITGGKFHLVFLRLVDHGLDPK